VSEEKPKGITVSQGQIVGVGGLGVVMAILLQAQDLVWTRNEGLENKARVERLEAHVMKVEEKMDSFEFSVKSEIKESETTITDRLDRLADKMSLTMIRQKEELLGRVEKLEDQVFEMRQKKGEK